MFYEALANSLYGRCVPLHTVRNVLEIMRGLLIQPYSFHWDSPIRTRPNCPCGKKETFNGLLKILLKLYTANPWKNTLLQCRQNKLCGDRPQSQTAQCCPCCPKMAEPVLYWAAAAGSNYWLGCRKWGQMQCIIREPVDSGSPSQWLVINKIIGGRWQRFLEFFLICMSFCCKFFMTSFFFPFVKSIMIPCPVVGFAAAVVSNWEGSTEERWSGNTVLEVHLNTPDIRICFSGVIQTFSTSAVYTAACHFCTWCATNLFKPHFIPERNQEGS